MHIGPLFVAPVDDGIGFTVTTVVYTVPGSHPTPALLTVSEYVAVAVGVATGFCPFDVKPSEPTHDHIVASVECELSVTEPPLHEGLLFVAPVDDGIALTVTTVVAAQPLS